MTSTGASVAVGRGVEVAAGGRGVGVAVGGNGVGVAVGGRGGALAEPKVTALSDELQKAEQGSLSE